MGDTAVNKTTSTLHNPAPPKPAISRQAKWGEDRSVFPIYLALGKQLEIEIPFRRADLRFRLHRFEIVAVNGRQGETL